MKRWLLLVLLLSSLAAPLAAQEAGAILRNDPVSDAGQGSEAEISDATVRVALIEAIVRHLRPHWAAPRNSDRITTLVRWNLNPDGSLRGKPVVVSQTGVSPVNRELGAAHAAAALSAVEHAAPFALPHDYYRTWQSLSYRFDRRL